MRPHKEAAKLFITIFIYVLDFYRMIDIERLRGEGGGGGTPNVAIRHLHDS